MHPLRIIGAARHAEIRIMKSLRKSLPKRRSCGPCFELAVVFLRCRLRLLQLVAVFLLRFGSLAVAVCRRLFLRCRLLRFAAVFLFRFSASLLQFAAVVFLDVGYCGSPQSFSFRASFCIEWISSDVYMAEDKESSLSSSWPSSWLSSWSYQTITPSIYHCINPFYQSINLSIYHSIDVSTYPLHQH